MSLLFSSFAPHIVYAPALLFLSFAVVLCWLCPERFLYFVYMSIVVLLFAFSVVDLSGNSVVRVLFSGLHLLGRLTLSCLVLVWWSCGCFLFVLRCSLVSLPLWLDLGHPCVARFTGRMGLLTRFIPDVN